MSIIRIKGRQAAEPTVANASRCTRSLPINCSLSVEDMVREAVNNLVHEYLLKMGFTSTLKAFKGELAACRPVSLDNYRETMRAAFNAGQRERFNELWDQYVPASLRMHDKETAKTEFFLALYFILGKVREGAANKTGRESMDLGTAGTGTGAGAGTGGKTSLSTAVDEFRGFLLRNGEEFSKIDDLLPYYALPFLKDPFGHPLFKELLTVEWATAISAKLDSVLNSLYSPKSKPYLLQLYEATLAGADQPARPREREGDLGSPGSYNQFEESNKRRSFQSFKDKLKAPLVSAQGGQQQMGVGETLGEGARPPSQKRFDSPTKAIQVKQYIARMESDNKRLSETVDLLTTKIIQMERQMAEAVVKAKLELGEAEHRWRAKFARLMDLADTLLRFGVMFKAGREHFIDTATRRLGEFRTMESVAPVPGLRLSQLEPGLPKSQFVPEPVQEDQRSDEVRAMVMHHLAGEFISQPRPDRYPASPGYPPAAEPRGPREGQPEGLPPRPADRPHVVS